VITLLLAEDHPLFREALRGAVLRAIPGAVLHEAENVDTLYALPEREADAVL
jgi:DNA-binding NarL/FixJ family response regulator